MKLALFTLFAGLAVAQTVPPNFGGSGGASGGGATIPSTIDLIKGDGAGNGADAGFTPLVVANGTIAYCADAGSTDAYACNLAPIPAGYVTGARYRFKANTANTGAATINFNTLGAKTIVKVAGGITTALADNDIRVGQIVDLVYDGTNMQMQSTLGNAPGALPAGSTGASQFYATSGTFGGDASVSFENITPLAVPPDPIVTNDGTGMTTYGYAVTAVNAAGETTASMEVQTTTSQDPPTTMKPNSIATTCGTNPVGTILRVYLTTASIYWPGPLGYVTCGSTFNDTTGAGCAAGSCSYALPPGLNTTVGIHANLNPIVTYPHGIADPSPLAVTPTCAGTCMTAYGYTLLESNGIGFTAPSFETTVNNAATLDGTHKNSITLPVVSDPYVTCWVVRTTGPASPQILNVNFTGLIAGPCDGSTIDDQSPGTVDGTRFTDSTNQTAGTLFAPGAGGSPMGIRQSLNNGNYGVLHLASNYNYVDMAPSSNLRATNPLDQPTGPYFGPTVPLPGQNSDNGRGFYVGNGDIGGAGPWWNVATATSASTYNIGRLDGFVKCDSAGGDVSVVLPDPATTFPQTPFGRIYTIHKPKAANSCTLTAAGGATINGNSSVVLTAAGSTVEVYWDADGDGNTPIWAISYIYPPNPTSTTVTTCATISMGIPSNCTNVTIP